MTTAFAVAIGVLGLSVLLSLLAVVRVDHDGSRAVLGDLIFVSTIGIVVLAGVLADSAVTFDVALLATMLGILATLALARMLTRGRR